MAIILILPLYPGQTLTGVSECHLHGVDEESLLGDDEVWSRQALLTVRNGHNF